ncbi:MULTISPECIES: hypothetical protein [Halolamina]|nr:MULTISPECIES: hypothetical protein [Halolamina]NHX36763.1 hypothetical protein [Halolamina sp. R1-12]
MAYGLIASAEALRYEQTGAEAAKRFATTAAKWLLENRDLDHDNRVGWGLPFAWDAFQDGSTNSPHHTYTITSALAARGILDVVSKGCIDDPQTRKSLIRQVENVADYLIVEGKYNEYPEGICFWYSATKEDSAPVLNPTAMFAGVLQRLGTHTSVNTDKREKYRAFADQVVSYLLSEAIVEDGSMLWRYVGGDSTSAYNDGVRAAYIVDGLLRYAEFDGLLADDIESDVEQMRIGLERFRDGGKLRQFISLAQPARVWGLGHLLYVFNRYFPDHDYSNFLLSKARDYSDEFGFQPRQDPPSRGFGAIRHTAHLLNGVIAADTNDFSPGV